MIQKEKSLSSLQILARKLQPYQNLHSPYLPDIRRAFNSVGISVDSAESSIETVDHGKNDLLLKLLVRSIERYQLHPVVRLKNGEMAEYPLQISGQSEENQDIDGLLDVLQKAGIFTILCYLPVNQEYIALENEALPFKQHGIYAQIPFSQPSDFAQMVYAFDYSALCRFRDENGRTLNSAEPENYLRQGYVQFLLHDLLSAYYSFRTAGDLYYHRRIFDWYFIAKVDQNWIGRYILHNPFLAFSLPQDKLNVIRSEVQAIDMEHTVKSLPLTAETREVFGDISSFEFVYSVFHNLFKTHNKAKEQAGTRYFISSGQSAISQMRMNVKALYRFTTENFLALDEYEECTEIYFLYFQTLVETIRPDHQKNIDGISPDNSSATVGETQIRQFDLQMALRYIPAETLKKILTSYRELLALDAEAESFFCTALRNAVFEQYDSQSERIFWRGIVLSRFLELQPSSIETVLQCIADFSGGVRDIEYTRHGSEINGFFVSLVTRKYKMTEEGIDILFRLLEQSLNQLVNADFVRKDTAKLSAMNLSYLIPFSGRKIEDMALVEKAGNVIHRDSTDTDIIDALGVVLTRLYKFGTAEVRQKVMNTLLPDDISDEQLIRNPELYWSLLHYDMMKPRESVEKNLCKACKTQQSPEGLVSHSVEASYLIELNYAGKILKPQRLKKAVISTKDPYLLWLYDPDQFDYKGFDVDWLNDVTENMLRTLSSTSSTRQKVKKLLKQKYQEKGLDDGLMDIYMKWFS